MRFWFKAENYFCNFDSSDSEQGWTTLHHNLHSTSVQSLARICVYDTQPACSPNCNGFSSQTKCLGSLATTLGFFEGPPSHSQSVSSLSVFLSHALQHRDRLHSNLYQHFIESFPLENTAPSPQTTFSPAPTTLPTSSSIAHLGLPPLGYESYPPLNYMPIQLLKNKPLLPPRMAPP